MDKYCPDGQPCESSGCSGIRCHRFELHATSDIRTYPYTEPCPHCAAKDAEIAQLRNALTDMLAGWRYIRAVHGDLYGVGWDRAQTKAENALRGEGE